MLKPSAPPESNQLLHALTAKDRRHLVSKTTRLSMEVKDKIYEKNATIHHVFFPLSGMYSIVGDTSDGKTAEVATVGKEGMLGLPVFLGTDRIPLRAFTQIPGEVLRMEAVDFRACTADMNGSLARLLSRYAQALLNQLAQQAACSTLHSVEIRCARWLLMCHDRVGMNEFPLTHEFLAQMLGVRRASVTLIARSLLRKGIIAYRRGIVTILDRKGLEAATCEHYTLTRDEYDRLLSTSSTPDHSLAMGEN